MCKRVASLVALCVFASGLLLVWQPSASAVDTSDCITYIPSTDTDPGDPALAGNASVFGYTTSWRSPSNTGKLVTMAPDGSQYTVVAEHWVDPDSGQSYDVSIGQPSFSADGSVMVANWIPRDTSVAESGTALFEGGPAGFGSPDIIPDLFGPQLSRDGSTIVFFQYANSISVMDVASRIVLSTLDSTADLKYQQAMISADGQTLVFVRESSGEFVYSSLYELVSYDIVSDEERVIDTHGNWLQLHGVSGDGDRVAYQTGFDGFYVDDAGTPIALTVMTDLVNEFDENDPNFFYFTELVSHVLTVDGSTWFFAQEGNDGDTTNALRAVDVDTNTFKSTLDLEALRATRFVEIAVADDQSIMIFTSYSGLTSDAPDTGRTLYSWDLKNCVSIEDDYLDLGVGVGADSVHFSADYFQKDNYYAPDEDYFCLSNVSDPAPSYAVVCWYGENENGRALREAYVTKLLASERPAGEVIWFGESDSSTPVVPTPVRP